MVEVSKVVGVLVEEGIGSGVIFDLLAAMAEETLAQARALASRELIPAPVEVGGGTRVVEVIVDGGAADLVSASEAPSVMTVVASTVLRGGV